MLHLEALVLVNVMSAISAPATAPPRSTRTLSCALVHVGGPVGLGLGLGDADDADDADDDGAFVGVREGAADVLTALLVPESAGSGLTAVKLGPLGAADPGPEGDDEVHPVSAITPARAAVTPTA